MSIDNKEYKVKKGDIIQNPSVDKTHAYYHSLVLSVNRAYVEVRSLTKDIATKFYRRDVEENFLVVGKGKMVIEYELFDSSS